MTRTRYYILVIGFGFGNLIGNMFFKPDASFLDNVLLSLIALGMCAVCLYVGMRLTLK